MTRPPLSWFQIFRLGLVQTALGAVVVLTTSTLNRIMVVELALPAMLPGGLVALHYAMQLLRPRLGHGSDVGGRRTPWIVGGMAILALGGSGAALATAWMGVHLWAGIALAAVAFFMIGIGVGACGTTLLVLLAKRVDAQRRAAAATIVWVMMIVGFIVTTGIAGHLLDPYSPGRLVAVATAVSVLAMTLTLIAIRNIEGPPLAPSAAQIVTSNERSFGIALAEVWSEPQARRFTIFIFVSMVAYSAPELILEPFAGAVFAFTPGESTTLASMQHGGVLAGMMLVALASIAIGGRWFGSMRIWTVGGCVASAVALVESCRRGLHGVGGVAANSGIPARADQRDLRRRRHRLDDVASRFRSENARRRAHGIVGRSASDRIRAGRFCRNAGMRPRTLCTWIRIPRLRCSLRCGSSLISRFGRHGHPATRRHRSPECRANDADAAL